MSTTPLISIVDDDVSVRESLCCLFRSIRFGVEAFASAEEFLSSDRIRDTKCLILDIKMPGMSEFELQRRLMASHPQMPVIFITAHNDDELQAKALDEGAIDYLFKPLSDEALLNAVQTALRESLGLSRGSLLDRLRKYEAMTPWGVTTVSATQSDRAEV